MSETGNNAMSAGMTAARVPYRSGLVTALDIGSSKVACLIARAEQDSLKIIGNAVRESRGVRQGVVVDLAEVETAVGDCVTAAETMADVRVQDVLVSVNCGGPVDVTANAAMNVDGAQVADAHLRALLNAGRSRCVAEGYEIIQSEPTGYIVDDARGVRDPSGLACQRLGVTMQAVAVKAPPLTNLKLAVVGCHMGISAALFGAYASALSVLSDDEKKLGATVIDMGGGVTSVAVFMEGYLAHVDVVPMGGLQVSADLARMLSTPMASAERIKVLYGAALGEHEAGPGDLIAVPQMGEEGEENAQRVPRSMLTRIIQARLEEIFSVLHARLREAGFDVAAGRRAVLTGGAAQMAGVRELASQVLNKQVRIGKPQSHIGLPINAAGPEYACAAGLILAGASRDFELINPRMPVLPQENVQKSMLSRLTKGLFG
ncbi:MAG: cell division protein FtsA [Rhizomicrobium sp.]